MFTLLSGGAAIATPTQSVILAPGRSLLIYGQDYSYRAAGAARHLVQWCESSPICVPLPSWPTVPVATTRRIEMLQVLCSDDENGPANPAQMQHLPRRCWSSC
jgi:hypothetical protein